MKTKIHVTKKKQREPKKSYFPINVLVYYSKDDKSWIAEGLEINQLSYANNRQIAIRDYIKAVNQIINLHKEDENIRILVPGGYSEGLEEIMLSDNPAPIQTRRLNNIEIRFYDGGKI